MSLTRLVAYQVNPDGHWDPVAFSKRDLKAKQVYILVDEQRREIWIWIGSGADVKTRFISSNVAAEIRRLYGLTYRVKTVDQGHESQIFLDCIDSIPTKGLAPELTESKVDSKKEIQKVTPSTKKAEKTTTKRKTKRKTTKPKTTKPRTAKPKTAKTTTKKSTTTKTTKPRTKKRTSKTQKSSSTVKKSLDTYLPQDTSVITTPPCPECEVGYLLPYSECLDQEGREPIILPFSKWSCSKCEYSPPHP